MPQINISIDCVVFRYDSGLKFLTLKSDKGLCLLEAKLGEDQDTLEAVERMVYKHTGVKDVYLNQFTVLSNPDRIDDSGIRTISIIYFALLNADKINLVQAHSHKNKIEGLRWLGVDNFPQMYLDHKHIVESAVCCLQDKFNHELSAALLPKNFTLPQLQKLFEDVKGKKMDKRNFRKQVLNEKILLKTSNSTQTGKKGKPASYYQYI